VNLNFVTLDHPRRQPCGSITLSKFGVDPIFADRDIAILQFYDYASLAGKWGFWGFEPLKIAGRHPNPQKAHP